jgi:hypothetical protein
MQFFHPPITSSLFCPNVLLTTFFSNTLGVRDEVSHPYKTTGKIISCIFKTVCHLTAEEKKKVLDCMAASTTRI